VVSLDGELIGVSKRGELLVTGRRRDAFGSLNFAVSSHALRDLLESVGDGVPLASWSGQEKSAVLPIALRLGEAVSDTILTAMRGAGPYLTKTSGRSLAAHALSVVSGFFRVSEADVSKFMWGLSFAPEWHSRHKAEWFTLFRDDHSETAYVDSTGHVMWWVMR
jgi:hypothetical protein